MLLSFHSINLSYELPRVIMCERRGSVPASPRSPRPKKSVFLDGRLEGIKIQGEETGMSMAEKMKQAARRAGGVV